MIFLDCPAYLDDTGATRCGLPAEVTSQSTMQSTDGPLDSATISCPVGHRFSAPLEYLTIREEPGHHRRAAVRPAEGVRAQPPRRPRRRPGASRGHGPSAYYLGRHAGQWIRALSDED